MAGSKTTAPAAPAYLPHSTPGRSRAALKIVIVGFGNIGQAVIALLQREFGHAALVAIDRIADVQRIAIARRHGVRLLQHDLTEANYASVLGPLLEAGDYLLSLAPEVSTCDLIRLAQQRGALYLDTGIEPWHYRAPGATEHISNYALREHMLALQRSSPYRSTAVVAHGANPGFVSILVKQALLEMARACALPQWQGAPPADRAGWSRLSADLDIRVIQISESDTQDAPLERGADEFINTWSVEGFAAECRQRCEIGFGTHEPELPAGAQQHASGCRAAIVLERTGLQTRVKSWSPLRGEFEACILTHNEAISIADYLTAGPPAHPRYRPTVYYAYRPARLAVESMALLDAGRDVSDIIPRVLKAEITHGVDELGVLLMSGTHGAYWLGSALPVARARALAPHNNATSLQVASGIVGALRWARLHPQAGIVESEQLDHASLFAYTGPYWEPLQRSFTAWRPQAGASGLAFAEFMPHAREREAGERRIASAARAQLAAEAWPIHSPIH